MKPNSYKKKNIGANAVLNTIRSCMSLFFPLITYPYAARILGVDNLGKINYGNSIVAYFTLLAALGVSTYSVRSGSRIRDDKEKIHKFTSQVFTINLCTTILSYILLIIATLIVPKLTPYRLLILIQGVNFILITFGVDWINTIYEDYYIVTIRTLISYIIGIILLFIFVRNRNDYYQYAIIQLFPVFLTAVLNWFYCRRYVRVSLTKHLELKKHLKPLLTFFANTIAIQIYVNVDMTMLGWIKGDYSVGIYSMSAKIYGIVKNLMVSIYAVTIPRLSMYYGTGDYNSYKKLNTNIVSMLIILLLPAGFGIIAAANEVVYVIGGPEYMDAVLSLKILGIALIFAIFGGLTTSVLNVTTGREIENLKATVIGAIVNAGLNVILIPKFAQDGAAFTTLIAEALVFLFCFIRFPDKQRYIGFKEVRASLIHGAIGSASILIIGIFFHRIEMNMYIRLACIVVTSIIVYVGELTILRNKIFLDCIQSIKVKATRK